MANRRCCVLGILSTLVLALVLGTTLRAADNWVGTWKLNVAKSTYSPGPAPQSGTAKLEAWDGGLKSTSDGVDADGKPTHNEFAAKFDGKDHPYKGSASYDTISVKRIDDYSYEGVLKKQGKVMLTSKNVISKDGKTRTQTQTGTDAQGRAVNNTVVWDRQ